MTELSRAPAAAGRARLEPWAFAVAVVTAASWGATVLGGRAMAGSMPMPGGWAMSMAWMPMPGQSAGGAAVMFLLMWEVMMIAMMLPSAMPMVLLHRRLRCARESSGGTTAPELIVLGGYFAVWLAFGAVAYALGVVLTRAAMHSDAVSRAIPIATGAALLVAGAFQCTAWKQRCLAYCRSPIAFLSIAWRDGWSGAFVLGLRHGAYCAACCWALMLMQLAVGVMNVGVMLLIACVIFVEKVWRHGDRLATAVGLAAIAGGLALIARPLLG